MADSDHRRLRRPEGRGVNSDGRGGQGEGREGLPSAVPCHPSSFERVLRGWGVLAGVPALVFLAYLYPAIPLVATTTLCAARRFLGFPCPGCGMTGAFVALVRGEIRASIDAHPLGIVVALWLLYLFGRALAERFRRRPLPELLRQRQRDWLLAAFLAVLFLRWGLLLWLRFAG